MEWGKIANADHFDLKQTYINAIPLTTGNDFDGTDRTNLFRRQHLAGAATNTSDFQAKWKKTKRGLDHLSNQSKLAEEKDQGIIATVKRAQEAVELVLPEFEHPEKATTTVDMLMTDQKRLCVLALSLYRSRLSDISIRDHVLLIWCILGGKVLRAHDGNAFFYQERLGAWESFMGLFPDYVFNIAKRDLLQVEGLFRAFHGEVPRTEEGLLKEIRRIFLVNGIDTPENIQKTMDGFVDNAIFQKGNSLLKSTQGKGNNAEGKGPAKGKEKPVFMPLPDDPAPIQEEVEVRFNTWYILTAQMISKCTSKVLSELMHENIIKYFSEWCETEDCRRAGCCYTDCIFCMTSAENLSICWTNAVHFITSALGLTVRCLTQLWILRSIRLRRRMSELFGLPCLHLLSVRHAWLSRSGGKI